MQDRRKMQRERVDLKGTIVTDDGITRVDGAVLNITKSGMRISVQPQLALPKEFYMLLPDHRMQACRVIWRDGMCVGLQFKD